MTDLNLLDWSAQEKAMRSIMEMRQAALAHKAKGRDVSEQLSRLQDFHSCIVLNEQLIGTIANHKWRLHVLLKEMQTLKIENSLAEAEIKKLTAENERLTQIINSDI